MAQFTIINHTGQTLINAIQDHTTLCYFITGTGGNQTTVKDMAIRNFQNDFNVHILEVPAVSADIEAEIRGQLNGGQPLAAGFANVVAFTITMSTNEVADIILSTDVIDEIRVLRAHGKATLKP